MKAMFCFLVIVLVGMSSHAQGKYDANWCFGFNAGINFSDTTNVTLFPIFTNSIELCSSVSSSNGELQFYLSGNGDSYYAFSIKDKNNTTVMDGDSLNTSDTYTNGIMVIPFHNEQRWWIFQLIGSSLNEQNFGLTQIFDSSGLRAKFKNRIVLNHKVEERIAVVKHANGKDWWLLLHQLNIDSLLPSSTFYIYLITSDTLIGPKAQQIGFYHQHRDSYEGEMTFSKSGNFLASAICGDNVLELYSFDRCNGILSNYVEVNNISQGGEVYSCEFSADETKLYAVETQYPNGINSIYQFDLKSSNVGSSKRIIFTDSTGRNTQYNFGQLQIAPNNKIYLASDNMTYPYPSNYYTNINTHLGVINQPDSLGHACDFQPFSFYLGDSARTYLGLPNMPNYNLGALLIYQADAGNDTLLCKNRNSGAVIGAPPVPNLVYEWQASATLSDTSIARPLAKPTSDTFYVLTVTDTSYHGTSCNSRTDTVWVRVQVCDGVEEIERDVVNIYPNPANNVLTVETATPQGNAFCLYDCIGRSVLRQNLYGAKNTLDISVLPPGLYFYKLGDAAGKLQILR